MSFAQLLLRSVLAVLVVVLLAGGMAATFWFVLSSEVAELDGMYDVYRYFGPITFFLN